MTFVGRSFRRFGVIKEAAASAVASSSSTSNTSRPLHLQCRAASSKSITSLSSFAEEKLIDLEISSNSDNTRLRFKTLSDTDSSHMDAPEMASILNESAQSLSGSDFMLSAVLPIQAAQNFIDYLHDFMPYYCAIVCVPFITKFLVSIPIAIISQRSQQKIMPSLPSAMKEYRAIGAKYSAKADKPKYDALSKKVIEKYGFNPIFSTFRPLVGIVIQVPVHMTFFIGTRTMFNSYPDWKFGGVRWFVDLSVCDPLWILPCCVGSAMAISFLNSMRFQNPNMPAHISANTMRYVMAAMCMAMIPISHLFSAGFNVYMTANILSYLMQTQLLNTDAFRFLWGMKPISWQMQYQRELREVDQTHKQKMKNEVFEDDPAKYQAIGSRKRLARSARR